MPSKAKEILSLSLVHEIMRAHITSKVICTLNIKDFNAIINVPAAWIEENRTIQVAHFVCNVMENGKNLQLFSLDM